MTCDLQGCGGCVTHWLMKPGIAQHAQAFASESQTRLTYLAADSGARSDFSAISFMVAFPTASAAASNTASAE